MDITKMLKLSYTQFSVNSFVYQVQEIEIITI
jgi:hypothetical protein